jgi:hypothetical protein
MSSAAKVAQYLMPLEAASTHSLPLQACHQRNTVDAKHNTNTDGDMSMPTSPRSIATVNMQ